MFDTLTEGDIWQYRYPDDATLDAVGVRGIYLGNFVRWDPKAQHEAMIVRHHYASARFDRTFDTYDHVDCFNYMDLHDQLKLFKHGYSRVTDHATREIRHGRLTRQQGLFLVRKYEQAAPRYLERFCEWLGIQRESLRFMVDQHRNPEYWHATSPGEWAFRGWSTRQPDTPADLAQPSPIAAFFASASRELDSGDRYITIGKGWPC